MSTGGTFPMMEGHMFGKHKDRRIQMRKFNFLTVAAALILAGVGTWAASTTHASVTAPLEIDPFQMMMSAPKNLPTQQEVDKRLEQMNFSSCDSACARAVQDYFTARARG
jgi:hypothetical protein